MAEITAAQVKALRERTGAGMMDCKSALTEANGDMDEAVKVLRKKGLSAASKKAGRVTSEGAIVAHIVGSTGVLLEVNSETDFVAKTDQFREFAQAVASLIATSGVKDVESLMKQKWPNDPDGHNVEQVLASRIATIGENISIRRFTNYRASDHGLLGQYIHANGKIGVLVEIGAENAARKPQIETVAKDIAMHVAAAEPRFVTREEVTGKDLDTEREVARDQALKSGKPEAVVDKIVAGKLEKFFSESVLNEQPYIRDDKMSVSQYLQKQAKDSDTKLEIRRFSRYKLGEGIEKRGGDFASEVMAELGR